METIARILVTVIKNLIISVFVLITALMVLGFLIQSVHGGEFGLTYVSYNFSSPPTFPFDFSMTINGQGINQSITDLTYEHGIPADYDAGTKALTAYLTDGIDETVHFQFGSNGIDLKESELRGEGLTPLNRHNTFAPSLYPGQVDYKGMSVDNYLLLMFNPTTL